jgi:Ni/Co efflux regulator RcnB
MNKFAVALAAAGFLLAAPALVTPASAAATMTDAVEHSIPLTAGTQLAQINVQIGSDRRRGYRHRHMHHRHHMHRRDRVCTTRVTYRNGQRVVVRRCR